MISVNIDEKSSTPKYRQIINSILTDIENGLLKMDVKLPSINELSEEYYLSRDTVEKAYVELREKGRIISVPGKGYFINRVDGEDKINVFFLVNKLSGFKKSIYESFVKTLGSKAKVDFYVYHNDIKIFDSLVQENIGLYNYYVIIPHFYHPPQNLGEILKCIPKKKLILLDRIAQDTASEQGSSVYQDFEQDIENALECLCSSLSRYRELILIFPDNSYYPTEIKTGFSNFCIKNSFTYKIESKFMEEDASAGNAYILIEDKDLLALLRFFKRNQFKPGEEIGVISYNEDPLKEFLLDGLTVISADHARMGKEAAEMILYKRRTNIKVPFNVIKRNSL